MKEKSKKLVEVEQLFHIMDSTEMKEIKGGGYVSWVGAGKDAGYCDIEGTNCSYCNVPDKGAKLGMYVYCEQ